MVNIFTALFLLGGCTGSTHLAPVDTLQQPPSYRITTHTVARGETLYSIAWRYTLDVNVLANLNNISSPYTVFPGQRLNLDTSNVSGANTTHRTTHSTPVTTRSRSTPNPSPSKVSTDAKKTNLAWRWPVQGTVIAGFNSNSPVNRGIDIAVKKGQPVHAAESGEVVYAGTGLRGYGKLLIIRHDENFLSAYAHNNRLHIEEGQFVKAGQVIAETGSSGTDSDKLHFEIRFNGKPVDPLQYLPRK